MDEFSDFQMAVQKPVAPTGNKGPRYSDSSPAHNMQGHGHPTTKSDLFLRSHQFSSPPTLLKPMVPPPGPKSAVGKNVGSRLANYDLGLSFPGSGGTAVHMNGNGFQNHASNGTDVSSGYISNPPKTISSPYGRSYHQDLLIGEEDKYSALRMFIETDISSTGSIFEAGRVESSSSCSSSTVGNSQQPSSNVVAPSARSINHTPLVSSQIVPNNFVHANQHQPKSNSVSAFELPLPNCDSLSKTGGVVQDSSDFGDFGDFQSFSGFTSSVPVETPNPAKISSNNVPFTPNTNNYVIKLQNLQSFSVPAPVTSTFPPLSVAPTVENGGCDSDGEFGDFVSVEPVVLPQPVVASSITNHTAHHDDLSPTKIVQCLSFSGGSQPQPLFRPEDAKQSSRSSGSLLRFDTFFNPLTTNGPPESYQKTQPPLPSPLPRQRLLPTQQQSVEKDDFDTFSDFTTGLTTSRKSSVSSTSGFNQFQEAPLPSLQSFPTSSSIPPTFIRTSLIRNDEVTDIDPLKWNQSIEESNNDPILDYIPFERKGSGGKSKFLDISPETRSIASLDLGNYVTVDYSESTNNLNNNNNNNNHSKGFMDQSAPIQNHSHSTSGKLGAPVTPPTPLLHHHPGIISSSEGIIYDDDYDKYQCFREECENEKERYFTEWTRCFRACKLLISKAFSVFNGVSTSEVIKEVVADEKGYSYVMNILEVYRIFQRIQKSAERIGLEHRLRGSCEEITGLWETLTAFLLGTCVSTEICQERLTCYMDHAEPLSQDDDGSPSSCGVCLSLVDTSLVTQCLDYGGKIYHCNCANFWVNEVDSILPSLSSFPSPSSSDNMISANGGNRNGPNCSMDYLQHEHSEHLPTLSKYDKTNSNSLV